MKTVPAAADMDDETLTKHLNLRHARHDYAGLSDLRGGLVAVENRSVRESYHNYCHEFGEYDHEHVEPGATR